MQKCLVCRGTGFYERKKCGVHTLEPCLCKQKIKIMYLENYTYIYSPKFTDEQLEAFEEIIGRLCLRMHSLDCVIVHERVEKKFVLSSVKKILEMLSSLSPIKEKIIAKKSFEEKIIS